MPLRKGMTPTRADEAAPLLLAVCGASAQVLALRTLQLLLEADQAVELVISRGAFEVWRAELGLVLPVNPAEQERVLREQCGTTAGCPASDLCGWVRSRTTSAHLCSRTMSQTCG